MSTTEHIERADERVNFWDGELRKATTQERIDLCERRLMEANERLKEANAIYLASMNQQRSPASAVYDLGDARNLLTIALRNDFKIEIFNPRSKPTSRADSTLKEAVNTMCGRVCCVCQATQNVAVAHILKHQEDCAALNLPWDESNFILLCGIESDLNSCHGLFDNFQMTFIFTKEFQHWTVVGGGPTRHNKVVQFRTNPHKRAIHTHLARCYLTKSITVNYEPDDLEDSLETDSS